LPRKGAASWYLGTEYLQQDKCPFRTGPVQRRAASEKATSQPAAPESAHWGWASKPFALSPVRPHVGADHAAPGADHARPEFPHQEIARILNLLLPSRHKPRSGEPRSGKLPVSDSPLERTPVRLPRCLSRRLARRGPRRPKPVKLTLCDDCGNATRTVRGHCCVCLGRKTS
jgi:hypothetical protein